MKAKPERTSITARLAIANLLRLADADLRDARVVMRGGSLRNAGMLFQSAVSRMTAAALIPEHGWSGTESRADTASLTEDNPVAAKLRELEVGQSRQVEPQPDGRLPQSPDGQNLKEGIERAADVLYLLTEHFEAALDSDEPAGEATSLRPPPLQEQNPEEPPAPKAESARPPGGDKRPTRITSEVPSKPSGKPKSSAKGKVASVEPPPSLELPSSKHVASTVFWSLMDRWGVVDLDALALIGHPGGLTQKGTRPRFKLSKAENDTVAQLQEVDTVLQSLGLDVRAWLTSPIKDAPLSGATPIAFMLRGQSAGVHDLRQYLLNQGLRLSLQSGQRSS
jgi:hypothetical protein